METEIQYKNRGLILINIVLLTFMACLDSSIVNVVLPVMAGYFKVGMNSISVVVSTYLIAISGTILIFGRLGDIKGTVKIFQIGTVIFTIGSLLCAVSNTLYLLVLARIIQAVGAAGFMATSQGIITRVFPAGERGKALGVTGSFVALGTLVGPPLGGFIVDAAAWQYIFLINIPIGIFAFILGLKILPKDQENRKARLDVKGGLLFLVFIVALFAALIGGEQVGFAQPIVLAGFAVAVTALIIFLKVEITEESPLIQLNIFKNQLFSLSILCGFLLFVAISCSNLVLPFYLQDVIKLSASTSGLYLMTYPMVLFVVAPISGHLSDKIGSELLTLIGLLIFSGAYMAMATLNENFQPVKLVVIIAIMALGNGMFQSPNNSLVMSSVPRERVGIAGSINALVRNLGLVVGVSVSTLILYSAMSSKLGYKVTTFVAGREAEFASAMRVTYICAGLISFTGAAFTAFRLLKGRRSARVPKT